MEDYPKPLTKQCIEKITDQMNNYIYKIKQNDNKFYTGFFCFIKKYKNKKIPVIIINTYIIDENFTNTIDLIINNEVKTIKIEILNI